MLTKKTINKMNFTSRRNSNRHCILESILTGEKHIGGVVVSLQASIYPVKRIDRTYFFKFHRGVTYGIHTRRHFAHMQKVMMAAVSKIEGIPPCETARPRPTYKFH